MKALFKDIIVSIISWQARFVLKKYRPRIVAVTGSVGKTSTKDAIFAVLAQHVHVRKSDKSFNSEIGVPLTILGLTNAWSRPIGWIINIIRGCLLMIFPYSYPKWLVLEVGADKPGDIKRITQWLHPDIAVITHIGTVPVHVEFFDSIEAITEEKRHLARALKKGGVLIVDADDQGSYRSSGALLHGQRTVVYGRGAPATIVCAGEEVLYDGMGVVRGMTAMIYDGDIRERIDLIGAVGISSLSPLVAAYAVAKELALPQQVIMKGLQTYVPPRGRKRLIEGIKQSIIIDDTYNASPVALEDALHVLKNIKTRGRRIALVGDMMELGDYSVEEHYKAGLHAAKVCDVLIVVGMRARKIAEGAADGGLSEAFIFEYEDSRKAGKFAETLITDTKKDIILVKGSQSVRMERAVEEIMAHPEDKSKLLVRQESEWINR